MNVTLATEREPSFKRSVDSPNSRLGGGSPGGLALFRLASRMRLLEVEGKPVTEIYNDDNTKLLTKALEQLGYGWELVCVDVYSNSYRLRITRDGGKFSYEYASSGEKALVEFVFSIYGLDVRDALIVIDEPELHLHPKWQTRLMEIIEHSASERGNQFVMATHSPTFISPRSIAYVSRVYRENGESNVFRLKDSSLPDLSKRLRIVNSQNNEKIFFTDLVVLVEGVLDRIFFERFLRDCNYGEDSMDFEVVEVGGKGNFAQYHDLLNAVGIRHVTVADLDYVAEVGTPEIKSLFSANFKKIGKDVLNNPKSRDRFSLATAMDDAIESTNFEKLRLVWESLKARVRSLRPDLVESERAALESFLSSRRNAGVFILSRGTLEDYLPEGNRGKDIAKLLDFLDDDYWSKMSLESKEEFRSLVEIIKKSITR